MRRQRISNRGRRKNLKQMMMFRKTVILGNNKMTAIYDYKAIEE
jgi:hypothetical protein